MPVLAGKVKKKRLSSMTNAHQNRVQKRMCVRKESEHILLCVVVVNDARPFISLT